MHSSISLVAFGKLAAAVLKVMPWEMIEQRIAFRKVCYSLQFFTQPMTEKTVTPALF